MRRGATERACYFELKATMFAIVPKSFSRILLSCAVMLASLPALAQQVPDEQDIEVHAKKVANLIVIDVSFMVQATPRQAWDVLVDYDRMTEFLPNLQLSKIISKTANRLQVAQKGGASKGPITISFDVVRDVHLTPYSEVVSHVVSGDLKKVDGITRVSKEGDGTRITFHSESIPNVWVPPGIGTTLIENETRGQFRDIRGEILKRKNALK